MPDIDIVYWAILSTLTYRTEMHDDLKPKQSANYNRVERAAPRPLREKVQAVWRRASGAGDTSGSHGSQTHTELDTRQPPSTTTCVRHYPCSR